MSRTAVPSVPPAFAAPFAALPGGAPQTPSMPPAAAPAAPKLDFRREVVEYRRYQGLVAKVALEARKMAAWNGISFDDPALEPVDGKIGVPDSGLALAYAAGTQGPQPTCGRHALCAAANVLGRPVAASRVKEASARFVREETRHGVEYIALKAQRAGTEHRKARLLRLLGWLERQAAAADIDANEAGIYAGGLVQTADALGLRARVLRAASADPGDRYGSTLFLGDKASGFMRGSRELKELVRLELAAGRPALVFYPSGGLSTHIVAALQWGRTRAGEPVLRAYDSIPGRVLALRWENLLLTNAVAVEP